MPVIHIAVDPITAAVLRIRFPMQAITDHTGRPMLGEEVMDTDIPVTVRIDRRSESVSAVHHSVTDMAQALEAASVVMDRDMAAMVVTAAMVVGMDRGMAAMVAAVSGCTLVASD